MRAPMTVYQRMKLIGMKKRQVLNDEYKYIFNLLNDHIAKYVIKDSNGAIVKSMFHSHKTSVAWDY